MLNISSQNGVIVSTGKGKEVTINGEKIETPKGMRINSTSIVDGKVYIGGYEFIPAQKKFKRTFKALWHLFF